MPEIIPDARDELDLLAARLAASFGDVELRLQQALALEVKAGLESSPDNVARAINLGRLRSLATELSAKLRKLSDSEVTRLLSVARSKGAAAALAEIDPRLTTVTAAGGAPIASATISGTTATVSTAVPDFAAALAGAGSSTPAAVALNAEFNGKLREVSRRILRWPDDVYRKAVRRSATDVLLGISTSRQAQASAWQELVAESAPTFVDSAGRKWNTASYVETATRTATRRAWDEQHEETYRRHNVELVTIVVGSGACKACADVAGRIWRVDGGETGELELVDLEGNPIKVQVDGTLDEARSHGWRHPNCRCRPVAYFPGLSAISDVTTYDPQAEKDRARLRALEREVRAEKAKLASALTPEDAKKSKARIRELQGKIRDHVSKTGLMRQRNREQLNLGNG